MNVRGFFWVIIAVAVALVGGFQLYSFHTQAFDLHSYLMLLQKRNDFVDLPSALAARVSLPNTLLNSAPVAKPDDGLIRAYAIDAEKIDKDWMIPYSWRRYTAANVDDSGQAFYCQRILVVDGSILSKAYSAMAARQLLAKRKAEATDASAPSLATLAIGSGQMERQVLFEFIFFHESSHLQDRRFEAQLRIDKVARALFAEGTELAQQGNLAAAEHSLRLAVEYCPAFVEAIDHLAIVLRHQKRAAGAVALYRRSLVIDPDGVIARQNLIIALMDINKNQEALVEARELESRDPNNPEGPYWLGAINLQEGNSKEALGFLDQASQLYRNQSNPLTVEVDVLRIQAGKDISPKDALEKAKQDLKEDCARFHVCQ
jgi:tetratricopeptide (TPR) repeat protein